MFPMSIDQPDFVSKSHALWFGLLRARRFGTFWSAFYEGQLKAYAPRDDVQ